MFEAMMKFPCIFELKVIGSDTDGFEGDMIDIVSNVTGVDQQEIKYSTRQTPNKKYKSISISATFQSADMLYECYAALDEDPRVKFKF